MAGKFVRRSCPRSPLTSGCKRLVIPAILAAAAFTRIATKVQRQVEDTSSAERFHGMLDGREFRERLNAITWSFDQVAIHVRCEPHPSYDTPVASAPRDNTNPWNRHPIDACPTPPLIVRTVIGPLVHGRLTRDVPQFIVEIAPYGSAVADTYGINDCCAACRLSG